MYCLIIFFSFSSYAANNCSNFGDKILTEVKFEVNAKKYKKEQNAIIQLDKEDFDIAEEEAKISSRQIINNQSKNKLQIGIFKFDLNHDGYDDMLAMPLGSYFCGGSVGCHTNIYIYEDGIYKKVATHDGDSFILQSRTSGYNDIGYCSKWGVAIRKWDNQNKKYTYSYVKQSIYSKEGANK